MGAAAADRAHGTYARNDTHYLKPLADRLKADLEAKGRLDWHQESCARLIADSTRDRPADLDSVWRIKGSHLLGRPALAVLRELWRWRETEAVAANRPPFFILSHRALVDIAAAAVTARADEPFLPRHLSERRRRGLTSRGPGLGCHPTAIRRSCAPWAAGRPRPNAAATWTCRNTATPAPPSSALTPP